jgi:hypothetical protein
MMYRYHVTYGVDKHIVDVSSKDKNIIVTSLRTVFNISLQDTVVIQQWDADFEDWVTVTDTEQLPDKSKLSIIVKGLFLIYKIS